MKRCFIIFPILACMLSISQETNGLECYKCAHVTGISRSLLSRIRAFSLDESCQRGSTPKAEFLSTCQSEHPGEEMVCGSLSVSTHIPFIRTPVEIMARNCVSAKSVKMGCNKVTREDLESLPSTTSGIIRMLPQSSSITMCACHGNKCNGNSAASRKRSYSYSSYHNCNGGKCLWQRRH